MLVSDLVKQVKKNKYWEEKEPVVLGVSGGLDSVVLLNILINLPHEVKPFIHVAHINHQLRNESDEEERFVRQLCKANNVPCSVHIWDKEQQPHTGIEKAAREVRYTFFETVATSCKSSKILTAHHRDDQIETVLMRFVRGNSLEELTGINHIRHEEKFSYIRPLLSFTKERLRNHAIEHMLTWHEDQTNQSYDYTRNRFRHKVLPLLREENEKVDDHIISFSEDIADMLSLLKPVLDEKIAQTMTLSKKEIKIDRRAFLELAPPVQKSVLNQAVKNWSENKAFSMKRIHAGLLVEWLDHSPPNSSLDLPNGLTAVREYNNCRLTLDLADRADESLKKEKIEHELLPNEWQQLSPNEKIGLLPLNRFNERKMNDKQSVLFLDLKPNQLPLLVRHRRKGDRMSIKGMKGTKKVKDIFIDQKLPLKSRDEAWVVSSQKEEILWLIGYKESALSLDPITDTISYVLMYEKTDKF